MNLFPDPPDAPHIEKNSHSRPLAERMRPTVLAHVVGQDEALGPGRPLARVVAAGVLPSLILWGPPGVGKTTLARILARATGHHFVAFSAVVSGVKELRDAIADASALRRSGKKATVVFIDEIHRFNKAQQDALLPHVEDGLITLIGATTENPSFEVNAALMSRCRLITLKALDVEDICEILRRALADVENGLQTKIAIAADALDLIASRAHGDARRALNALEFAVSAATAEKRMDIDRASVAGCIRQEGLLYDKAGDEHFNVTSALIKSLRGSDPHAAVYYLARMLEAGEDPLFVARRLLIFAAEDVGNADPAALSLALAAFQATHAIGMPEAKLPLTQATLYLATAPKSNTALSAYAAAREDIAKHGSLPTPKHIRNASTKMMADLGYGRGYQYPHEVASGVVDQVYLPDAIASARYYAPTEHGFEREIRERMRLVELERAGSGKKQGQAV